MFLPGAGETSRNNQPPPLASFIPFYLHLNFSQQADRVIISDGSRFSLSNTVFSPCVRNNGVGFILAINEFITLLERGDFFDWNQFTQKVELFHQISLNPPISGFLPCAVLRLRRRRNRLKIKWRGGLPMRKGVWVGWGSNPQPTP